MSTRLKETAIQKTALKIKLPVMVCASCHPTQRLEKKVRSTEVHTSSSR